jgi:hypothetical protein
MVVFGVSATALIAQREREVFRRGAQERTLALVTALDTELSQFIVAKVSAAVAVVAGR